MKSWKLATMFAAALLLLVPSAVKAQPTCPAGVNPLSVFVGTWSYQASLVSAVGFPPLPVSYGSAGQFTASIGIDRRSGGPAGVIRAVQSSIVNGNPVRLESDDGTSTYSVFSNCGGVTISLNFSTRPVAFDCWFQAGRSILYCVSIVDEFPVILHASRFELVAPAPAL